ncbi:MAG: biotin--[acetyl-CoA-carboxylase] ligase [Reichenbachiella sp.]
MHKFFANTRFLGKKVTFLPQCHSTNDIACEMVNSRNYKNGQIVLTHHQTNGKGQRGNVWESLPNQNATFSLIINPFDVKAKDQFDLHIITSLAIKTAVQDLIDVKIKWPNDIYVHDNKIGGILIENSLLGKHIKSSVIGIGLNINQTSFSVAKASSLNIETGKNFTVETIIESILYSLEDYLQQYQDHGIDSLKINYLASLYQFNIEAKYESDENQFIGKIIGVDTLGKLQIKTSDIIKTFDFKEVKFC